MNEVDQKLWKKIIAFFTNRLFILFVAVAVSFYLLVARLFWLQVVNGEIYQQKFIATTVKPVTIQAPRGTIYDRYGRPLAVNESSYTLKIDPNLISLGDINKTLYALLKLLEKNGEKYSDDFPISLYEPYNFLFDGSESREKTWKLDMEITEDATADEAIKQLRKKFKIDEGLPSLEARKLLSLRSAVFMQRYRQYEHITVCYDIKNETLVSIEENSELFSGVYVDVDFLRRYPQGKYLAHIIGTIRGLTEESELELFGEGYKYGDIVGKSGIERSFEKELKGVNGTKYVEMTDLDKQLRTISTEPAIQGNKIFLTIDAGLQQKSYEILEDVLKQILIGRLKTTLQEDIPITPKQFFISLVESNTISIKDMFSNGTRDSASYKIKEYVVETVENADIKTSDGLKAVKDVLKKGIDDGNITLNQMLILLYEQGYIKGDEDYIDKLLRGKLGVVSVLVDCLENGTITPQMTGLDPSSGSIVVSDVKSGDVLAAVGYPSYDSNQFVNNFNSEYYNKVNSDPTSPFNNRPFSEARAPGSTFKMISAIAGLETGTITPKTKIYDYTTFTKAGSPYTRCWSPVTHGLLDVSHALEVSCNYFFTEMSYSMGNMKEGTELEGIGAMNKYMIDFGFNEPTGVEISEWGTNFEKGKLYISSPEYKERLELRVDPNAPKSQLVWYDGDTVKTSIGQAKNNYTAASMAKYIATLATGGERYKFHLLDKIETQAGENVKTYEPVLETVVQLSDTTLKAVYDGMLLVLEGDNGTAGRAFKDFPIRVAGKTGTAQERDDKNDHSSFGGFAPFEDPQIAIYVVIPFGDTKSTPAAASQAARKVLEEYFGLNAEAERPLDVNTLVQ